MDTPQTPPTDPENDWITPLEPVVQADENADGQTSPKEHRFAGATKIAAPVIAAVLVGGGAVFAFEHTGGSSASTGNTPVAFGQGSQGGFGGPGGQAGGVAGEQHIQGTVTAKTSSTITVKSSSGSSATYTVNETTEIVRNGHAATLAEIKVGDPVFVHVYPSATGVMLVERLYAGTSASDTGPGGGGFGGPPSGSNGVTPPNGSTT